MFYQANEYKKYLWSSRYLVKPIFLLVIALSNLTIFTFILIDSIERNQSITAILLIFIFLGLVSIGFIIFFIFSIKDMIDAKVRVKKVEATKITYNKSAKSLRYKYNGKELDISISSKWEVEKKLPQWAKIWMTYHTKSVLRIEFLETGEVFDVNIK